MNHLTARAKAAFPDQYIFTHLDLVFREEAAGELAGVTASVEEDEETDPYFEVTSFPQHQHQSLERLTQSVCAVS